MVKRTMVIVYKSPKDRVVGPLPFMAEILWLIDRGLIRSLLTSPGSSSSKVTPGLVKGFFTDHGG